MPERNPQLDEQSIFTQAINLPAEQLEAYLNDACGDDGDLRQRIERLLVAHRSADALEQPLQRLDGLINLLTPEAGDQIGSYRLIECLGEGGMGVVYRAHQTEPVKRDVALKIVKPGFDSQKVLARFASEQQALALMDHPNIARVLDAGETDTGRPFFAMELVDGEPITDYCDRKNLSIPKRLRLFLKICQAIQHAHHKGVIHRDVKPSNVLVCDQHESTELNDTTVKVIDFGVAKSIKDDVLDSLVRTGHTEVVGTPLYMSPEQANASQEGNIDTRTDVYSLGVLLYELLTGVTPFDKSDMRAAGDGEIRRIICDVDPPLPSERLMNLSDSLSDSAAKRSTTSRGLSNSIRGELDWIIGKAMEKDRQRRYETANALASDVERYLNDEVIEARRPSMWYRARKFSRKHRSTFAIASCFLLLLTSGAIGGVWLAARATTAERLASKRLENEVSARKIADDARAQTEAALVRVADEARMNSAINAFLREDLLQPASPFKGTHKDIKLRTVVDRAAATVGERFLDQPEVESAIRKTLANIYIDLGELKIGEDQLQKAIELQNQLPSTTNLERLRSAASLVAIRHQQRRFDEAIELGQETLQGLRTHLGPNHHETLTAASKLATMSYIHADRAKNVDDRDAAERLAMETLTAAENARQNNTTDTIHDPAIIEARISVARIRIRQKEYAEAERLVRLAIEELERHHGPNHPKTLDPKFSLAEILGRSGRPKAARQLLRELLEASGQLGVSDPTRLFLMRALAEFHLDDREYKEADALLSEVYSIQRREEGSTPNTRFTMGLLGRVYEAQEQWEKVASLFSDAKDFQVTPSKKAAIALRLANAYRQLNKPSQAEQALLKALTDLKDDLDTFPILSMQLYGMLGELQTADERYTAAEQSFLTGWKLKENMELDDGNRIVRKARKTIASFYRASGNPDEAKRWEKQTTPKPTQQPN